MTDDGDGARVLVVVAHPDDEVLGCGALIVRVPDLRVIHVTDGAPRDGADAARRGFASPAAYAAARAAEARAALARAGVAAERVTGLGVADQEAARHMPAITRGLADAIANADLVLTHAFEIGHPDHDAVAFAVHAACRAATRPPRLVEMPFYHAAPSGWRRQTFLPNAGAGPERVVALSAAEQDLKARMIAAHASQAETLRSFDRTAERFRAAPAYDFTQRPHVGPPLYERHGWKLDWPTWVALVRGATVELGAAP